MFDFVRNNTKIMMGLLFLLIIPSFVLFGLEGYSRFDDKGIVVAKVDEEAVGGGFAGAVVVQRSHGSKSVGQPVI